MFDKLYSAIGLRYEVMNHDNDAKQNIYQIMMDEHGMTIWMNDISLHEVHYGVEIE